MQWLEKIISHIIEDGNFSFSIFSVTPTCCLPNYFLWAEREHAKTKVWRSSWRKILILKILVESFNVLWYLQKKTNE